MLKDDDEDENLEAVLDVLATHIKKEYDMLVGHAQRNCPEKLLHKCVKYMETYRFPLHYRFAITLNMTFDLY